MEHAAATDVLVVDAGPTGLVLALWLAKAGVRVHVIDQHAEAGTPRARSACKRAPSSCIASSASPTRWWRPGGRRPPCTVVASDAADQAGLARSAAYGVRPGGYVGLATTTAAELRA